MIRLLLPSLPKDVPCIPWSGSSLKVDYSKEGLPEETFSKACVKISYFPHATCFELHLADDWGNAIALLGRHQKIIEEGPVVAAPPNVWREMERAAVRLAEEVGS